MRWNYLSIPKLQRLHRWSLGMDKLCQPTLSNGCNYLPILGLKLNHVSKRALGGAATIFVQRTNVETNAYNWRASFASCIRLFPKTFFGEQYKITSRYLDEYWLGNTLDMSLYIQWASMLYKPWGIRFESTETSLRTARCFCNWR